MSCCVNSFKEVVQQSLILQTTPKKVGSVQNGSVQMSLFKGFRNILLRQDGAPPHYGRDVRTCLNTVFLATVDEKAGKCKMLARSQDLSPLDYFVWGYLKDNIHKTKPQNLY